MGFITNDLKIKSLYVELKKTHIPEEKAKIEAEIKKLSENKPNSIFKNEEC